MSESMVSAEHYNALKLERDQMAARAERLEHSIEAHKLQLTIGDDPSDIDLQLYELLPETTSQSLLIHDADLLDHVATHTIGADIGDSDFAAGYNSACKKIYAESTSLRLQAKEKTSE